MITIDTITLPDDLWWEDETEWSPVEQTTEYSTTGSLLVDIASKLAGRPITLAGAESTAWVSRQTVLDLLVFAATPAKQMTLVLHDRSFTVIFSYDGKPVDVEPIIKITPPAATDYYYIKGLRFLALAEIV